MTKVSRKSSPKRKETKSGKKTKIKLPSKFLREMENVGLAKHEIIFFSVLGIGFWGVLAWIFVDRYLEIKDSAQHNDTLKDLNIAVLSFHVLTLFFIFFEAYYINRIIWVSWLVIGCALTAVLFNTVIVANSLSTADGTALSYSNKDSSSKNKDIISLALQVFAICLMTAYIFKLIRSKNKMMY